MTACKPISDEDLGMFIAGCIDDENCMNKILPIGGAGDAITPMDQARALSKLAGREVPVRHVPVWFLAGISRVLSVLGVFSQKLADKAELAGIGHYYATESMLVWDAERQTYDASATPSFGEQTLFDHYEAVWNGRTKSDLGAHSVF